MNSDRYYVRTKNGRIYTTEDPSTWHDAETLTRKAGREAYRAQAKADLLEFIRPGDTIYCILRHVSASGMSRRISLYAMHEGKPRNITGTAAIAMDRRLNRDEFSIVVGGCGMDMGFHLVYSLGFHLFPDGFGIVGSNGIISDLRPLTKEKAADAVTAGYRFHGRNGDSSGWDNDGGYALRHEWL